MSATYSPVQGAIDPAVESFLESTKDARLESYFELLRIPSISTLPEHAPDIRRAAEWIAAELRRIGFEHVEVSPTRGHPIVYADWLHAEGAPTILVYCHYDVQPVDPIELWETAPFEPFVRDGRVVGRGAADDKGQLHMHLKAAEAILATRGRLPVNLRFLFEGEEEHSSVGLEDWLRGEPGPARRRRGRDQRHGLLRGQHPGHHDVPARHDVRPDRRDRRRRRPPLRRLRRRRPEPGQRARPDHHRAQGGRRHGARSRASTTTWSPPTREERFEISCLPFDEAEFRKVAGVPELVAGEPGFSILECMRHPADARRERDLGRLHGRGLEDDHPRARAREGQLPPRARTRTARSCSSSSGTTCLRSRRKGVRGRGPEPRHGRAHFGPTSNHPVAKAAARALEATFGMAPVSIRSGGSIPVAPMFESVLGLPVVMLGFTNPDDNAHAPNETMVLLNYETGLRTITRLWDDLRRCQRARGARWEA